MAPAIPIEYTGQKEYRKCSFSQLMRKSREHFKGGNSSGFFPGYQHVIETMGESEGFGSSGRVDTEMTASEDSYAPKRKCISLNSDSHDNFGVPTQVLPLSKMSRPERKDLELRLKMELEQVRVLQKKVASLGSSVGSSFVVLSPSTDNRSCSDGKKRPPLENFNRSVEVLSLQAKKRPLGGRNGARPKKSTSTRLEQKPTVAVNNSNTYLMKQCETLLNRLMQHNYGWVFNNPVDAVKLNIPDYFTVIKHPMDLGTVKKKIASGQYSSPSDFAVDVRLTFSNAMTYNPPGNDVHCMAETLSKYFEVRWKAIEKKLPVTMHVDAVPIEVETNSDILPLKKNKINPKDTMVGPEPVRQIMTNQQKQYLSTELESLLGELPENIVDFLKEHSSTEGQMSEDEIEIDIDALSDETLFKLRKLLDDYLLEKQKNQAKAEPCEMEFLNESGFSNSSMQPCKGNDQVDEVVDIVGGNDPSTSGYPPVEIEKDLTHRNSRCRSSSSSSSESDSDSGSESDAAKASLPVSSMKENLDSGTNVDLKNGSLAVFDDANQSLNEFGQVELNSHDKPSAVEVEGHQEEDSAPSERQVSPEKLYRAAFLRNRFADTILKAREKALEKGEKGDPEKLRMEREELERRQREEKARLQAAAKAAEEARRKAEADAAAEAKRKREEDREAARQALLKVNWDIIFMWQKWCAIVLMLLKSLCSLQMEKTVDINENSQFMEDLEMLRTTDDENLPNFIEETSPGHSQNGLGSFKLQGRSNPLEQLGLYMKADDEYEEDEPPQSAPEPVNDVEEGEID
ncbi:transcription factor GTE10-like isoform X2 [Durio zibethinus]|uniref:Transcription factor GTE10-like isoform X2 n=1 Tax=Durio zibethinus TaxID=66656 RepID=A0A6P6AZ11_DURZI|nr:transcription factor GTE10-like isoform X2 [Durio zibethinus]